MALDLHGIEINPSSNALQYTDRLPIGVFRDVPFPASGAAVTSIGAITAGTGYTSCPTAVINGGTLTAGVSPADPAVVAVTSLTCVAAPAVVSMGLGVAINDTFNPPGTPTPAGPYGTGTTTAGVASKFTCTHIQVATAVVNAPGTGGTPGPVTVTGTTGTGTKWQGTGVITAGGALSGPIVVTVAGDYTATPTLAGDTITGGSLSTCTCTLVMGAKTLTLTTAGAYSNVAGAAVAVPLSNVVGAGTGVTATCAFGIGTAVVAHSGNYSAAPAWTITPTDGNGSGASIATGSLGGSGVAIPRQVVAPMSNQFGVQVEANNQLLTGYTVLKNNYGFTFTVGGATTLVAGTVDVITMG